MTTGNKTGLVSTINTAFVRYNNGTTSYSVPGGVVQTTIGRQWVGVDDPLYQQKIDRGLDATNAYTLNRTSYIYRRSARQRLYGIKGNSLQYSQTVHTTYGYGSDVPAWDAAIIAKNTNVAMSKMWKKLAQEQNAYGGLELLGEFRETLRMIRHPAEALAAYANERASKLIAAKSQIETRKGKILRNKKLTKRQKTARLNREAKALNKLIASSLLEFRFGAEPFLNTLADIANASLEVWPEKGAIKILTTTCKTINRVTKPLETVAYGYNVSYLQSVEDEYEYTVKIIVRKRYSGQYDGMDSLQLARARGGFDLSQVIPTMWELAPLSVFADYFVNVGDILTASMTETRDIISVQRQVTRKLLRTRIVKFIVPSWGTNDILFERTGSLITYHKQYTREKWAMVIPTVTFTTPAESLRKTQNLLAFVSLALFN